MSESQCFYTPPGWDFECDEYYDTYEGKDLCYVSEWCSKKFVRDLDDYDEDAEAELDEDKQDPCYDETEVEIIVAAEPVIMVCCKDGDDEYWDFDEEQGTIGLADNWEYGINVRFPSTNTYGYGYSYANKFKRFLFGMVDTNNFEDTLAIIDTYMAISGWNVA